MWYCRVQQLTKMHCWAHIPVPHKWCCMLHCMHDIVKQQWQDCQMRHGTFDLELPDMTLPMFFDSTVAVKTSVLFVTENNIGVVCQSDCVHDHIMAYKRALGMKMAAHCERTVL